MARTPLFIAVELQQVEEVHQLLMAGVNVREPSVFPNWTPLRMAVLGENPEIVDLLSRFGANTTELTSWNATFLHLIAYTHMGPEAGLDAVRERQLTDVARRLIQHGVDVSVRDDRGFTALQMAARNCHVAMVSVLLACPDLNPLDIGGPNGQTAEEMVAALLVTRVATALPEQTAHVDATREILAMLRAEPERRTQERRAAFAMALIPRLGVASPVKALDPELVRMVLETP